MRGGKKEVVLLIIRS